MIGHDWLSLMMKTLTKITMAALALGSAVVTVAPASAQDWRGGYGNGYGGGWRSPREQGQIDRYLVDSTCSGQRGYMVENRLRLEVNRGTIDRRTARRIQAAINDLQDQERHECEERDFHSAREIGKDYIRVRAWIDQESGNYRGYWRR